MGSTIKQDSRKDWNSGHTIQEIQAGAVQRIADASETIAAAVTKMGGEYRSMEKSLKFYKELAESRYYEIETLKKQVAAHKGVATRFRRRHT